MKRHSPFSSLPLTRSKMNSQGKINLMKAFTDKKEWEQMDQSIKINLMKYINIDRLRCRIDLLDRQTMV